MSTGPQYFSAVFLSLFIAALVSVVLRRRQRKQQRRIGTARTSAIFVVAAFAAFGSLLALTVAVREVGLELGKWAQQAIQVASALVSYLVAGMALARIQRSGN